jgi:hypothetical protein
VIASNERQLDMKTTKEHEAKRGKKSPCSNPSPTITGKRRVKKRKKYCLNPLFTTTKGEKGKEKKLV